MYINNISILWQAIGHVCEECGTILTGELFTLHGRVLCETDFKVCRIMKILVTMVILMILMTRRMVMMMMSMAGNSTMNVDHNCIASETHLLCDMAYCDMAYCVMAYCDRYGIS